MDRRGGARRADANRGLTRFAAAFRRSSSRCSRWPSWPAEWSPAFSPACSASAAARSSCRCSTRSFASSACRRKCACSFASAPRSPSSCRPPSAPIVAHRGQGIDAGGYHAAVGAAGVDRRGDRLGARGCSRPRRVQARLRRSSRVFIACKLLFGRESWRLGDDLPRGLAGMRRYGFLVGLVLRADGGERRIGVEHDPDALRQTIHQAVATSAGLGVPITIAGTLGYMVAGLPHQALMPPLLHRLCLADRLCADGAGVELYGRLWCAARALAAEAHVGNRLRHFPAARVGAISREPVLNSRLTIAAHAAAGRRALPSFSAG